MVVVDMERIELVERIQPISFAGTELLLEVELCILVLNGRHMLAHRMVKHIGIRAFVCVALVVLLHFRLLHGKLRHLNRQCQYLCLQHLCLQDLGWVRNSRNLFKCVEKWIKLLDIIFYLMDWFKNSRINEKMG